MVRQAWRVARKRHPISCGGWLVIWRCDFDGAQSKSSPLRTLMVGTVSRTARVSVVRPNLKEAAGKTPARRTGTAYEAVTSGREGH